METPFIATVKVDVVKSTISGDVSLGYVFQSMTLGKLGMTQALSLPMLMKSDLYWHVMPNPKSLQNPVSFLIT